MTYDGIEPISMNAYQELAGNTAVFPERIGLIYTTLGLVGEAGEIANKVKKIYRDKSGLLDNETRDMLTAEIGDVLWYVAMLARELKVRLGDIAEKNLAKLSARKQAGTLQGSGDKR